MSNQKWWNALKWGALVGFALSVLTACTVSMSGGLLGALASIGVAVTVFLLAGATQTGCVEDPTPEPESDAGADAEVDAYIGPCLSQPLDMDIGPCLSPLEPDMGDDMGVEQPDFDVGPCLSPPEPDRGLLPDMGADMAPDMEIGPCLDVPAPDQGTTDPDAFLGPCLSPPPPDPEDGSGQLSPEAIDRAAVFDKVAASLPADIAARLKTRS